MAKYSTVRGDRLEMRMQTKCTPAQRAAGYLKRVVALTGAKKVQGDRYWLRVGSRTFLVDHKFVRVLSRRGKSTCFSVVTDPDMPSAEVVASALLQLKNNPRLFKKWRKHPGFTFKPNGKIFTAAGWLAGDET
jgi:hypothetical protein